MLTLLELRLAEMGRDAGPAMTLTVSAAGDNMGCGNILQKMYTSAEPGASIVRQIVKQCASSSLHVAAVWIPRSSNTWADILSKGWPGGPMEKDKQELFTASKERKTPLHILEEIAKDVRAMSGS